MLDLPLGADDHGQAVLSENRVGLHGQELGAAPDPDDVQPRGLSQPDLTQALAYEGRVMDRELGDQETAKRADHVGLGVAGVDAAREMLARFRKDEIQRRLQELESGIQNPESGRSPRFPGGEQP